MSQPRSMDSLGHQHRTKKLCPKIARHFKVLGESKAMLPMITYSHFIFNQSWQLGREYFYYYFWQYSDLLVMAAIDDGILKGSIASLSHNTLN